MGIPKFFRWMSERYPAISQLIAENRIPEFDCLYLDMNGIIHNCTHKDSDDTTFRMSEEQMFITIFNYIEHLFGKIKPKQLFYMAIDGVAPRAKMNQQRARRFRTALDVELANEKAIREGKKIPKDDAFDSNSITPGTEFMHKLTAQLKYFISKKVSDDTEWQGLKVILSGHEVPGEGEHKIMEYIRTTKAQPEYDPNIRHCLYGLDADLIMLGLLSHDPHFCLLREEVSFGRSSKTKAKELEHQRFYLMHLCVVREYLELEFQELKKPGALKFNFDLERVIDDFILMAFFVGNDFLPNLPNLHINEGALALMFKVYKTILPKAGGYLNEGGVINLKRLNILLGELSHVEYRFFEADVSDQNWFKAKKMAKEDVMHKVTALEKISMSSSQREVWLEVKKFLTDESRQQINLPHRLTASERKFFQDFAERIGIEWKITEDMEGNRHMRLYYPETDENTSGQSGKLRADSNRTIEIYDAAEIIDISAIQAKAITDRKYEEKFLEWKNKYYMEKFEWGLDNNTELVKLCENYVQGLQWVLFYYYQGVASWAWFYRYHYSPMISDVTKGLNVDLNFKLSQPFYPFEQLMGVLPDRSKKIIPNVYHDLMTNPESPIIDFYPRDFELDMNGKKMEWEAVVKIPFIDEARLLAAMAPRNHLLSREEKKRNEFGVTLQFYHDPDVKYDYPSSLIHVFPDIHNCHCVESEFILPTTEGLEYHIGLTAGVKLGDAAQAGFPSLKTLPYTAALGFHGANVFQSESRNESIVITLEGSALRSNVTNAIKKLGQKVYVGYPYLQEAKVSKVSDELFDYFPSTDKSAQPRKRQHNHQEIEGFHRMSEIIENYYSKHLCIVIGPVESIIHVEMLKGLLKTGDGATVKEYAVTPGMETEFAAQVIVDEVINEDQRFLEQAAIPIGEEFPPGSRAYFLGEFHYGRPLEIIGHENNHAEIWLAAIKYKEQEFGHQVIQNKAFETKYVPAYTLAHKLGLNSLVLSRITSSFSVATLGSSRLNLGLNLKFESKKLKVLGYTRKSDQGWEYSNKAIELINAYMTKFPEFFAGIARNFRASEYNATDFYPPEIADSKIKEIINWLKSIESKNFEKVPLDSKQLDSDVVAAIEQAIDATLELDLGVTYKKLIGVPRTALLKPSDAEHRLGHQTFALGDRVVYVPDSGRVPIATRGIVVGITPTSRTVLLDILCFSTFMSGTTLGGRCTKFRGCTVPKSSVINITNRQVVTESKAMTRKQLTPKLETSDNKNPPKSMCDNVYSQGTATSSTGSYRGTTIGENQNGIAPGYSNNLRHSRGRGSSHEKLWPALTPGNISIRSGPPRQTGNGRGGREMSREVPPNKDREDSLSPSTSSHKLIFSPKNEFSGGSRRGSWSRGKPRPRLSRGRGSYQSAPIHQP